MSQPFKDDTGSDLETACILIESYCKHLTNRSPPVAGGSVGTGAALRSPRRLQFNMSNVKLVDAIAAAKEANQKAIADLQLVRESVAVVV
jgi:hypothetical protein